MKRIFFLVCAASMVAAATAAELEAEDAARRVTAVSYDESGRVVGAGYHAVTNAATDVVTNAVKLTEGGAIEIYGRPILSADAGGTVVVDGAIRVEADGGSTTTYSNGCVVVEDAGGAKERFDFADPASDYYIIRKRDLAEVVAQAVSKLTGNCYLKTQDGGATIEVFYRDEGEMATKVAETIDEIISGSGE